jgi:hypothetical protein
MYYLDVIDPKYRFPYLNIDYDGEILSIEKRGYLLDKASKMIVFKLEIPLTVEDLDNMGSCLRIAAEYWSNGDLEYSNYGVFRINGHVVGNISTYDLGDNIRDLLHFLTEDIHDNT